MATITATRIPFTIVSATSEVTGYAVGETLKDYAMFEVRLKSGEIFNIEAIPAEHGYFWYSFEEPTLTPIIGKSIEAFFLYQ
jgi:hypothetical protein